MLYGHTTGESCMLRLLGLVTVQCAPWTAEQAFLAGVAALVEGAC